MRRRGDRSTWASSRTLLIHVSHPRTIAWGLLQLHSFAWFPLCQIAKGQRTANILDAKRLKGGGTKNKFAARERRFQSAKIEGLLLKGDS